MTRVLTWVSIVTLVSAALSWAAAFQVASPQGSRYYHSASEKLFMIGALTGLAASVLTVWP